MHLVFVCISIANLGRYIEINKYRSDEKEYYLQSDDSTVGLNVI